LEAYFPAVTETHQWKDRKKSLDVPIFPGYVFSRFVDSPENRLQVLRASGTVRILGRGLAIEAIPDVEIFSLKRLLASKKALALCPFLREGSMVRVTKGPLRGAEGRLIRVKNDHRIVLSLTLLSQSVATEIDARHVETIRELPDSRTDLVACCTPQLG
jgi:transcription antitermination factor NusG